LLPYEEKAGSFLAADRFPPRIEISVGSLPEPLFRSELLPEVLQLGHDQRQRVIAGNQTFIHLRKVVFFMFSIAAEVFLPLLELRLPRSEDQIFTLGVFVCKNDAIFQI
jgi:hypothetical protein